MQINLIAVGRMKAGPERALYDQYAKRLTWPVKLIEVEEKKRVTGAELKKLEGEKLLAALPKSTFVVVLDENGQSFPSEVFAQKLDGWMSQGQDLSFLVGGADGHTRTVLDRANAVLSLGQATWPHMLIRGLLLEQLYRAQSILNNHPYHRA
jgi:23S rRNA (pseudouridine1915-N3)-methyltransferase